MFASLLLATAIGLGVADLPVELPNPAGLEPGKSQILVNWPEGSWTNPAAHATWEHVVSIEPHRYGWTVCVEAEYDEICFNVDL